MRIYFNEVISTFDTLFSMCSDSYRACAGKSQDYLRYLISA